MGPKPHKQNLVVRLRGRDKAKPILFLAHLDVVEARREDWSVDPFQLTERDGYFYGRGTMDIKDEAADLVANLLRLKAEGYVPDRDIIVALTDDEEGGDDNGVSWLLQHRPELIRAAYVINTDAGGGQMDKGRRLRNPVQTSEKIYATYLLEVTGAGGHSSLPPERQCHLHPGPGPGPAGHDSASRYVSIPPPGPSSARLPDRRRGQLAADLSGERPIPPIQRPPQRLAAVPMYNSSMRTTCVATMLQAGHAENALPQRARATIQCRLLPGESPEGIRKTLARVVADYADSRDVCPGQPESLLAFAAIARGDDGRGAA